MPDDAAAFLLKAHEGVLAADAAFAAGWYTVCARTAYFAAFHAAIAALLHEGVRDRNDRWDHAWVQAAFNEQLIVRRKFYSSELRSVLVDGMALRHSADYSLDALPVRDVRRALRRCSALVAAIEQRLSRS